MDNDENNNNENNNQIDNENKLQETKQAVEQGVNLAKNIKSGNIGGAIKNAANLLKNKQVKKKIIMYLIKMMIPVIILLICAMSIFSIFTSVSDKMDKLKSNITTFTTSVWKWLTQDYWIDLNKEIDFQIDEETGETEKETLVDGYMQEMENLGISLKDLKVLGDADYSSEEVLNNPDNVKLMQKYLKEFIRADIISQEIHRRNPLGNASDKVLVNPNNEDEVDGGIYLYRSKDDLSSNTSLEMKRMKYKTQNEFETLVNNKDSNIEDYFTVDEETGLLIFAELDTTKVEQKIDNGGWTTISDEKVVTTKESDYKSVIAKYTLPFEYLINLCMVTQNPEFVYRVALMARCTDIRLVVLDEVSKNITEVEEESTTTTLTNIGSDSASGATSSDATSKVTTKTTVTENNPTVVVQEVKDSWIYKGKKIYTKTYNKGEPQATSNTETYNAPTTLADTGTTTTVEVKPSGVPSDVPSSAVTNSITVNKKVYSSSYVSKKVTTTTTTTESNTYDNGVIEDEIIKSDDFLGLLRNRQGKTISESDFKSGVREKFLKTGKNVKYKIPNATREEYPLNKLESGAEILFSLLRQNSKTQDLEKIMRYLLQFPTGKDYGVSETELLNLYEMTDPPDGTAADGGIIVKTDMPGAVPKVTREQLIQIINATYTGQKRINALSIVDALIQGEESNNVSAVFVLAITQRETSVGTANTSYVRDDKNWTSYNLGHTYSSASECISTTINAIANGSYYFGAGKYTIHDIGLTYCPNIPSYPTQGDYWVSCISASVISMYNKIGVQVTDSNAGTSGGVPNSGEGATADPYTCNGKTYQQYKQFDSRWGTHSFAGGTMKNSGCSLTSVAIVLSGYGYTGSPEGLRQECGGQMTDLIGLLSKHGVSATRQAKKLSSAEIISQLRTGKPIIANVNGPWTNSSGHYMVLLECDAAGKKVFVSNPGAAPYHKNGWYDVDQISQYTKSSAGSIFIN